MSKNYEDWADWAGDHPEQAEAELRASKHRLNDKRIELAVCGGNCEHEVSATGHCLDCGIEVEGWEPDDAQLLSQFGTKEPVA